MRTMTQFLGFILSFSVFQTVFVLEDLHPPKPAKNQISYATYQADFAKKKALLEKLNKKAKQSQSKISQLKAESSSSTQLSE